jgi:acyl transferase domain-containing protein
MKETAERAELVAGLHALADWLEARPGVPVAGRLGTVVSVWLTPEAGEDAPAMLGQMVRAMGRADKHVVGSIFELRREFRGQVRYALSLARERVCERVVVGHEQVEEPDYELVPRRTVRRERVE